MTKSRWTDSLGRTHILPADLLMKGGPAAFTAPPPPCAGAFRLLVDELRAFRERRRRAAAKVRSVPTNSRDRQAEQQAEAVSRADHLPTIRARPGRPAATGTVRKSFAAMAAELTALAAEAQRETERIQQQTAIGMFQGLHAAAKAGKLDALSAAKLDALQHRAARALGLETTGVRA